MVLRTGRPVTKKGAKAAKHRKAARQWYQDLPQAEKDAYVARRSKEAQRKADAKRYAKNPAKRKAYHKERTGPIAARIEKGELKPPTRCSRCGSTKDVEYHHRSDTRVVALCTKCNNRSKPSK